MLQYIDQEIRDLKNKEEGKSYLKSSVKMNKMLPESRYSREVELQEHNHYEDTLYYTFY